ncbi:hypothetical protein HKD37_10G028105 [Glycine soja]
MQRRSTAGDLIPIDLEINATYRRCNSERIKIFLWDLEAVATPEEKPRSFEASSSFPIAGHSHIEFVEDTIMAEEPRRVTLEDYSSSTVPQFFTSIAQPEVQAQTITYPPSLIQLIQNNLFHGLPNEDPYAHLATYIEICNTIRLAGVPANAIRLSLFSFSLSGEAKRWLHSFKGNSLKSWDEVVEKFLKKYFPESKTAEGKATISSFHQFPNESLSEALERFRGLLRKTPTHGFSETIQLSIFIDGLRPQSKQLLDALAGGKIKMKTPDEVIDLIESMAASDIAILRNRANIPTKKSLLELTSQDALLAQNKLLSEQLETLTETLKAISIQVDFQDFRTASSINSRDSGKITLENRADKKVEGSKQQLADELALEPTDDLVELEEIVEEAKEKVVEFEKKKGKSGANIEKKKEASSIERKELEITLPFGEALQQMPLSAKFLKDMLTKKNRYIHSDRIVVEGNYSTVIQRILPPKHKDPRVVMIPCSIGEVVVDKALIDLGASINLMPLSMCR